LYFLTTGNIDGTVGDTTSALIYGELAVDGTYAQYISTSYLKKVDDTHYYLYSCNQEGSCAMPTLNASKTAYFLSGVDTAPDLIKCIDNQVKNCVVDSSHSAGYYLNAGSDKAIHPVLSCDGTKCQAETVELTQCGKGVGQQVVGGLILDNNEVKVCVADGKTVGISNTSPVYKTITTTGNNHFPGISAGTYNIKFATDGRVYPLVAEGDGLNSCTIGSDCKAGIYYKINNKICLGDGSKNCNDIDATAAKLAGSVTDSGYVYVDKDHAQVEITQSGHNDVLLAYKCSFTDGTQDESSCSIVKKTFFYDTPREKVVYCNGWAGEGCVISTSRTCDDNDEGKLIVSGTTKSVCFGSHSVPLPSSGSTFSFLITSGVNTYYGINDNEKTLLELSSTSVTIGTYDDDYHLGYHLNQSIISAKEALIYCPGATIESCVEERAFKGYYIDASGDASKKLIRCTNRTTCEL